MRVHTPCSCSWSVSVWTRSVAFVVAALCLAFTDGQAPSTWQSGTPDVVLKAAEDLGGLHPDQARTLDHAQSVGTVVNCGFCQPVLPRLIHEPPGQG